MILGFHYSLYSQGNIIAAEQESGGVRLDWNANRKIVRSNLGNYIFKDIEYLNIFLQKRYPLLAVPRLPLVCSICQIVAVYRKHPQIELHLELALM